MSCEQGELPDLSTEMLKVVAFEIIEQCNFYCSFCVRNAHKRLSGKVGLDLFRSRLGTVIKSFPQLRLVAITGGEPFLHPGLLDIVRSAVEAGRDVSITTNASIVSEKSLVGLAKLERVFLIISLDGPSSEVHDAVRGFSNAFSRLVEFTKIAVKSGLRFGVNITVSCANISYVQETIFVAARLGASDISVSLVKPEGRGEDVSLSKTMLAEVSRQIARAKSSLSGSVYVRFTEPLAHIFDVSVFASGRGRTCGAGGSSLHIQCDGNVLLCTSCTQSLGNIDELGVNIRSAWEADWRLRRIREKSKLVGACGQCPVFEFCGGCRCRAEKSGNFLGEDPLCPRSINSEIAKNSDVALATALTRISPIFARDPISFKSWLKNWCNTESFDRVNTDFSSQRRWGHDYLLDEGELLKGEMGNRHIEVLRGFLYAGVLANDLSGFRILDIGPWTGGEALLLAALGGHVDFAEEHSDYREVTVKMAECLDLSVHCIGDSLYNIPQKTHQLYDVVYLSGIISHLSDPVVGMRIAFDALKEGGICLIETQTSYALDGKDEFWGANRPGWVWWNLSRITILEILRNVGFDGVEVVSFGENRRIQICARKLGSKIMSMRMGLSKPVGY